MNLSVMFDGSEQIRYLLTSRNFATKSTECP